MYKQIAELYLRSVVVKTTPKLIHAGEDKPGAIKVTVSSADNSCYSIVGLLQSGSRLQRWKRSTGIGTYDFGHSAIARLIFFASVPTVTYLSTEYPVFIAARRLLYHLTSSDASRLAARTSSGCIRSGVNFPEALDRRKGRDFVRLCE